MANQQEILDAIHRVGSGRIAFTGRATAGVDEELRRRLEVRRRGEGSRPPGGVSR